MRHASSVALISLFLILQSLTPAQAHDLHYFEYAPDPFNSQRLSVSLYSSVAQLFQTRTSIELTGIDLWIDNTGGQGSATITLRTATNAFLAAKTITVPSLAPVQGGHKFHIDFDQGVTINSANAYKIEITSAPIGLGLYHSRRASYLEHNQTFSSPYFQGAAQLESESQTFSFKYALYAPTVAQTSTNQQTVNPAPPDQETPPEQQAEESPTTISITNARVSATTATTATIAWTTNIATDSRVAIRTQLSPLFIYTSAYDATLELEHAITVTGLMPDVYYFADVFSGQGNTLLLSTYTIAFQTPEGSADPSPASQNPADQPQAGGDGDGSTTNNETNGEPVATNNASTSTASSSSTTATEETANTLPPLSVGEGDRSGNFSIRWSPPASGEPSHGYRIDIFNSYNQLERQFFVSAGEYEKEISQLPTGTFRAVVYANNDGVFTKIAEPFSFVVKSRASQNIWVGLSIIIILFSLGAGWAVWWFMREKSTLPVIEE